MTLVHKLYGSVQPLEAAYFHGAKVLIVRRGDGEHLTIFVGDSRWAVSAEDTWEVLRGLHV